MPAFVGMTVEKWLADPTLGLPSETDMPQPDHVMDLAVPDESALPEDLRPYWQKCRDKLGLVPNVLKAWSLRPEKLRTFIASYNELMLGPSGLSKLEREMIAVAVSAA